MKIFINLMLYISVFIPLYILIIFKTIIDVVFGNISLNTLNSFMLIILTVLIAIGSIGVIININLFNQKKENISIIEFKNITDQHFLNYFSLFVLFAITFDLSKVSYSIIFFIILCFIGVVYMKNGLYYINPLLNILGFSFYEIVFKREQSEIKENGKVFCKSVSSLNKTKIEAILKQNNIWFILGGKYENTTHK